MSEEIEILDEVNLVQFFQDMDRTVIDGFSFAISTINYQSQALNRTVKIQNCTFLNGAEFLKFDLGGDLIFENCVFDGGENDQYLFEGFSRGKVTFRHTNQFNAKTIFKNFNNIELEVGGQYSAELQVIGGNGKVSVRGSGTHSSSYSDIVFSSTSGLKQLLLRDLKHDGTITFHGAIPEKVSFANGSYGTIKFHNGRNLGQCKVGNLNAKDTSIKLFEFPFLYNEGSMEFLNVEIDAIRMNHLNNDNGIIDFRSIIFNKEIQFQDSNLSNVKFIDTHFHGAKLYLDRSLLGSVVFSNITWTEKHSVESLLPSETDEQKTQRFKVITEVYRQLKKNSISESDHIRALKFYRNEMDSYWNRIKIDKTESRANRLLIRINKISSNFGQSYWLPLRWILLGQLIICLIIWNLEASNWCGPGTFCSSNFGSGLAEYLTWLVPIYKTPEHWTDGSKAIGVLMRVYNGYFIYHFIKATRKFGKI